MQPSIIFTQLEIVKKARSNPQLHRVNIDSDYTMQTQSVSNGGHSLSPVSDSDLVPLPETLLNNGNDGLVPDIDENNNNIDLKDIFITSHNVGRGKTATVHQALYKNTVFVALKEFVFQNLSPAILDEVSVELYIVLEWLPGGCLHDLLHETDADKTAISMSVCHTQNIPSKLSTQIRNSQTLTIMHRYPSSVDYTRPVVPRV